MPQAVNLIAAAPRLVCGESANCDVGSTDPLRLSTIARSSKLWRDSDLFSEMIACACAMEEQLCLPCAVSLATT